MAARCAQRRHPERGCPRRGGADHFDGNKTGRKRHDHATPHDRPAGHAACPSEPRPCAGLPAGPADPRGGQLPARRHGGHRDGGADALRHAGGFRARRLRRRRTGADGGAPVLALPHPRRRHRRGARRRGAALRHDRQWLHRAPDDGAAPDADRRALHPCALPRRRARRAGRARRTGAAGHHLDRGGRAAGAGRQPARRGAVGRRALLGASDRPEGGRTGLPGLLSRQLGRRLRPRPHARFGRDTDQCGARRGARRRPSASA